METSMYDDGPYNTYSRENVAQMKRKFTLDLNGRSAKKSRPSPAAFNPAAFNPGAFNPLLTSPDLKMLKLGSPELDELVQQQGGGLLPTSGGFLFPGHTPLKMPTPSEYFKSFQPVSSTEFIKGFQDTLEQLQSKDTSVIVSAASNSCISISQPIQYTQLEVPQQQVPVTSSSCSDDGLFIPTPIKEEPQTVPSVCGSPPVSPINMENQEKIKLERKRLRNRIAASKCRRRKLEKISRLEDKVGLLKNENTDLQAVINKLRDQVCGLKQEVMEHVHAGCQIPFVTQ